MEPFADLHVHTNCSDGSDSPERVVERAVELGVAALAITDHDTVAGCASARTAALARHTAFLNGVEISASHGPCEVHVIGLGIDTAAPDLVSTLDAFRQARSTRVDDILARLHAIDLPLTRGEVEAQAAGDATTLGRIHIARAILARGWSRTVQDAFDKYIRKGRKAYVPRKTMSCADSIDLIHAAGGLAFLAHPGINNPTRSFVERLLHLPFDGIEAYHTKHTPGQVTAYLQLAESRGILVSGGSDCHGTATKPDPDMGKVRVPQECFSRILEALKA